MILRWTVIATAGGGGAVDIAVDVEPSTTLGHVWDQMMAAAGRDGADEVGLVGQHVLQPTDVIGRAPLLDGTEICLVPRLWPPPAQRRPPTGTPVALVAVSGPDAGRTLPLRPGRLVMGRHGGCDLVVADPDVSRRQCEVEVLPEGVVVRDLGSTNGTQVRAPRAPGGVPPASAPAPVVGGAAPGVAVPLGGSVLVGATRLEVRLDLSTRADPLLGACDDGTVEHAPGPRRPPVEVSRVLTVAALVTGEARRRIPWLAAAAPMVISIAVAVWWGSPIFLLMGLLGPVVVVGSVLGDRRDGRRTATVRRTTHDRAVRDADAQAARAAADVLAARLSVHPDLAVVLAWVVGRTPQLWQRAGDDDDLVVRVGVGDAPTGVQVDGRVQVVAEAPLTVDLHVGVAVTGDLGWRAAVGRGLLGRAVTQVGPDRLRVVVVAGSTAAADRWAWTRWLPHAAGPPSTAAAASREALAEVIGQSRRDGATVLVVADDVPAALLNDLPAAPTDHGLLVLLDPAGPVPQGCRDGVVQTGEAGSGVEVLTGTTRRPGTADQAGQWWVDRLGRAMAPLRCPARAGTGDLPQDVWLPALLRGDNVARDTAPTPGEIRQWWQESTTDGLAVPLAVSSAGPVEVDLVRDGPHALIGGTTGSGKSELLRSMVVGLACRYPPSHLSFLLVDFKGGATLADCARLPHAIGLLTDLDPYEARRVLSGMRAEVSRREGVLAAAGVSDLAALRRLPGATPIPRLVCVVDEFRVLAEQAPDVLEGLVHVASVGRSLGVHLVLATQRPSGVVSADIRANTALRIALRVQDAGDSRDVIESSEAAELPRDRPGQAVVRRDGQLVTVQTARVDRSTPRDRGRRVWRLDRPTPSDEVGIGSVDESHPTTREIVTSCVAAATATAVDIGPPPWLAPLPAIVTAADVAQQLGARDGASTRGPSIAFALADLPDQQRRCGVVWQPGTDGQLIVVGGPHSGRTTALAGLLHAAVQQGAQAVALSGETGSTWPDGTTVVDWRDADLLDDVLIRLTDVGVRDDAARDTDEGDSWSVVAVDDCDALLRACAERPATLDRLLTLARDGGATGVAVALAGGRDLGTSRLGAGGRLRVLLRPADPFDSALIGVSPRDLPHSWPPGRGLVAGTGLSSPAGAVQIQIALPPAAGTTATTTTAALPRRTAGIVLPTALPRLVASGDLPRATWPMLPLGVRGDADIVCVDPTAGPGVVVVGPPSSGRTTALQALAWQASRCGVAVSVLTPTGHEWEQLAQAGSVVVAQDAAHVYDLSRSDGPHLLVIDGLDLMASTAEDLALATAEAAPVAGSSPGLVVSCTAAHLGSQFRGYAALVRRHGSAVLLRPGRHDARDVLSVAAPGQSSTNPGRALLVTRGRVTRVQVARVQVSRVQVSHVQDAPGQEADRRVRVVTPVATPTTDPARHTPPQPAAMRPAGQLPQRIPA